MESATLKLLSLKCSRGVVSPTVAGCMLSLRLLLTGSQRARSAHAYFWAGLREVGWLPPVA